MLDRAVDGYFTSGLASLTVRTYNAGIKHYSSFCDQLNTQATPTSEPLLCRFVTHPASIKISHNTIKVYLAGVRQLHVRQRVCMPVMGDMLRLN